MINAYGEADLTTQNGFQEALCILALIGIFCAFRKRQTGNGRAKIRLRRARWRKAAEVWVL